MYSIRLEGDTQAALRRIRSLSEIDRLGINAALGQAIRESTLERFQQSRGPDGRRWKTSIRAAQTGGKTLVDTAQLRNSIRVYSDDSGFAVGTNAKHAATHQFGEPGRTIRARRAKALRFQVNGHWVTKKQVRIKIPARPLTGDYELTGTGLTLHFAEKTDEVYLNLLQWMTPIHSQQLRQS